VEAARDLRTRDAPDLAPPRALGSGAAQQLAALTRVSLRSSPRPSLLEQPLTNLRGAGPKLSEAAAELGVGDLAELLVHVPHTYRDRREFSALAELAIGQEATVLVEVKSARLRRTRRRNLTIVEATIEDESGSAKAVWFNQAWLAERLQPGTHVLIRGTMDSRGLRVSTYELLDVADRRAPAGLHTTGLVPVHPASETLRAERLREWAWQAKRLAGHMIEPLPAELRARLGYPAVGDALVAVHFPTDEAAVETARRRLAFEELLLHQAALSRRRRRRESSRRSIPLQGKGALAKRWLETLPFDPTDDQTRAFAEIGSDLEREHPMQRLLMGEVGSGKTVVALHAMLRTVESGAQAALMAPTETLAEQHGATLRRLLEGVDIEVGLLTGSVPDPERRSIIARLASGELSLVVGTHALIQSGVSFARLALAAVDEQHRFGVEQRAELDAKGPDGIAPHALHLTATPIPRTLSLTAYGDLDATLLRELPAGRRAVRTWWAEEEKREPAYEYTRKRLREGRQAFVVCPLVADSEKLQARAATEEAKRLAAGPFRDFSLAVLHGQLPTAAKQQAMARFASGEVDILVATSVIEVGIDVPNAAVMLIESADRYGLSQLHQLRGRVGRGEHESACILFSDAKGETARRRLEAIASENDGFRLAEVDLALRGEGEILGTRQHGLPRFRVASLPEDIGLLVSARDELKALLREHGSFDAPELALIVEAARRRFGDELDPIAA
jgi:ATP-dependent DNA helicase RecG